MFGNDETSSNIEDVTRFCVAQADVWLAKLAYDFVSSTHQVCRHPQNGTPPIDGPVSAAGTVVCYGGHRHTSWSPIENRWAASGEDITTSFRAYVRSVVCWLASDPRLEVCLGPLNPERSDVVVVAADASAGDVSVKLWGDLTGRPPLFPHHIPVAVWDNQTSALRIDIYPKPLPQPDTSSDGGLPVSTVFNPPRLVVDRPAQQIHLNPNMDKACPRRDQFLAEVCRNALLDAHAELSRWWAQLKPGWLTATPENCVTHPPSTRRPPPFSHIPASQQFLVTPTGRAFTDWSPIADRTTASRSQMVACWESYTYETLTRLIAGPDTALTNVDRPSFDRSAVTLCFEQDVPAIKQRYDTIEHMRLDGPMLLAYPTKTVTTQQKGVTIELYAGAEFHDDPAHQNLPTVLAGQTPPCGIPLDQYTTTL